ncbi:MAG: VCBS repeat-containing protein [Bacteroidetes bacterium]|nr:VCBS repeat-containing protein [Bacteroidota bacterium]
MRYLWAKAWLTFFLLLTTVGEIYAQAPVISSFSPASGPAGATVTINGSNFAPSTVNDVVFFGSTAATLVSATASQLVVKVPITSGYNKISVVNITNGLLGTSGQFFDRSFSLKDKLGASNFEINSTIKVSSPQAAVACVDIDGDGKIDIVVSNSSKISLYRNIGTTGGDVNAATFDPKVDITMPGNVSKVVIQDIDGDGKPDIVATAGTISILKNNAQAGLAFSAATFTQISLPFQASGAVLAVGDVDNDGKPDIIAALPDPSPSFAIHMAVLKNTSQPGQLSASSFSEAATAPFEGGNASFYIADLDGDGKPDIVATDYAYNTITFFRNIGSIGSPSFSAVTMDIGQGSTDVAVTDIDQDGKPDLLVTTYTNKLLIYKNNSTPGTLNSSSFSLLTTMATGATPFSIKIADMDGDGKPDILITNSKSTTITILRNIYSKNDPSGSFFDIPIQIDIGAGPDYIQAADLNGDGLPDLVATTESSGLFIARDEPPNIPVINSFSPMTAKAGSVIAIKGRNFTNDPSGVKVFFGYRPAKIQSINDTVINAVVPAGAINCLLSVAIPAINRTGRSTSYFKGLFTAKKNIESSDFRLSLTVPMPGTIIRFADLDGDGFTDLIYIDNTNGQIAIQHNVGQSKPIDCSLFTKVLSLADPISFSSLQIADLNNDGLPDIVVQGDYASGYYLNTSTKGNIQFAAYQTFAATGSGQFLDLDRDGRLDLVTGDHIFRNMTNRINTTFNVNSGFFFGFDPTDHFISFLSLNDADGDGKLDIFTVEGAGGVVTVRQNQSVPGYLGITSFTSPLTTPITGPDVIRVMDVDNDGKLDFINDGKVYKNNSTIGAISYQPPAAVLPSNYYDFLYDLNGDGEPEYSYQIGVGSRIDTMVIHQNRAAVGQLPLYDKTTAKLNYSLAGTIVGDVAVYEAIEDLNNDNRPDLIYYDSEGSKLLIFENITAAVDTDAAPTLTSFTPASGNPGSSITIKGTNFDPTAANNNVLIGNAHATVVSASTTQIVAQVPPGALFGTIAVNNLVTKLKATSVNQFVVTTGNGQSTGTITGSTFSPLQQLLSGLSPNNFAIADLLNDGHYELLVLNGTSFVIYTASTVDQYNNPAGFTATSTFKTGGSLASWWTVIDIDGDGKPEIVLTDGSGIRIYENHSSAGCGFAFTSNLIPTPNTLSSNAIVADINGDGKPDLLTIYNGVLKVLINNCKRGSISFFPYQTYIVPTPQNANENYLFQVTDIDGDGKPDIIVDLNTQGVPTVLLQNLGSTPGQPVNFAPAYSFPFVSSTANGFAARDIDGDGKPDLLVLNGGTNAELDVYKNLSTPGAPFGASSLGPKVAFQIPTTLDKMTTGDFDGDGKVDVLVTSSSDTVLYILQNTNNTPGFINSTSFGTPVKVSVHNPAPNTPYVVDFNRDGKADIVIRTRNSAGVLNNGGLVLPVPTVTASGPTTFQTGGNVVLTASPAKGYNYQWFRDGVAISGATSSAYTATQSGAYTVELIAGSVTRTSVQPVDVNVVFSLPITNFYVTINAATCHGANDGSVAITTAQVLNYTATITGNGLNAPYPFTSTVNINNLAAGTYNVCITVAGQSSYSQCYDVVITQPKDLSVYSVVNPDNTITLMLDGGNQYQVTLNGKLYTTSNNSIRLPLAIGNNNLSVTTDRLCQGTWEKVINGSDNIIPYPVPFQDVLNLNLGNNSIGKVNVWINDISTGKLVYSNQYVNISGVLQLDTSPLENGAYVLHLVMDKTEKTFKIIKK